MPDPHLDLDPTAALPRPLQTPPPAAQPDTVTTAGEPAGETTRHQTPARATSPAPEPPPGFGTLPEIPGYIVEAEIARGGMGVVYRARHLRLNRPAAVKMILGGKYHDPTARVRFLIEAEAVAQLDHPHVVSVYEFGSHDGLPFFALEYLGGGTLAKQLARDRRTTPREAAELLAKLADGIAAAHAKGIVHRDLKPANILLTDDGEPKVADFGLAKVGQSDMTTTGAVMGTPSYMSPEQAAGRVREVGPPTDVYALGALLYEVLTGRPPFKGDSVMDTLQLVMNREPERPRSIRPGVPRDLETIALKCLEKDPRNRYRTAAELAAELRAYLDGRPISARPVGSLERGWKWVKRNKVIAGSLAAVVAALVAGTVVSVSFAIQADGRRVAAERAEAETAAKATELAAALETTKRAEAEIAAKATELAGALDTTKRAEAHALTERDKATEVNEFFRTHLLRRASAYNHAGPTFSPDPDLKVRTTLDSASKAIDGQFPGRPLVEAAIRLTLGETYRDLGLLDEAQPHVLRAVELRERHLPPDHDDTLDAVRALAWLREGQGRYPEAERLRKRVVDARRARGGEDDAETLLAASALPTLYLSQGRYVEARDLAARLAPACEKLFGPENHRTLTCLNNLAQAYLFLDRVADAEPLFVRVLAGRRKVFGNEHPSTLVSISDLSVLRATQGRHAEADELSQEALTTQRRVFGENHSHTLTTLFNHAVQLSSRGKYAEAEKVFTDVYERRKATLGDDHPHTLLVRSSLGTLADSLGQPARAEEIFADVYRRRLRVLGPDHLDTLQSKSDLGDILRRRGKPDEGGRLLEDAYKALLERCGGDAAITLTVGGELGAYHRSRGDFDRAEELLRLTAEGTRRLFGPGHKTTLFALNNLGYVYYERGQFDRVERLLVEIVASSAGSLGEHHPERLTWMANLASVYRRRAKFAEAEPLLVRALDGQRTALGDLHPKTLGMMGLLASLYEDTGRHPEAHPLFVRELDGLRKTLPADDPELAGSMVSVGQSLLHLRRPVAAEALFRETLAIREKKLPDDWRRFAALMLLGESLLAQRKFADAAKPLRDGYEGLNERSAKIPAGRRNETVGHSARLLVRLADATGDPDGAAKWRAVAAQYRETAPPPRSK